MKYVLTERTRNITSHTFLKIRVKGLVYCDYWPRLGLKQRWNLPPFWATCIKLSRALLSSCLSHFPLIYLTFCDYVWRLLIKEKERKIYILREKLWRIDVCLKPGCFHSVESRWKWVKMPNNFNGFQTWGCLLSGDWTRGFIIFFM